MHDQQVLPGSGKNVDAVFKVSRAIFLKVVSFPPVTVISPFFVHTTFSRDSFEGSFLPSLKTGLTPAIVDVQSFAAILLSGKN